MRQKLIQKTIKNVCLFGCCVGILYGGAVMGMSFWKKWHERDMMRAAAAWTRSSQQLLDEAVGAETPEEAYEAVLDAVQREDVEAARAYIEGGEVGLMDSLRELPDIDRVTFLPDIVSGIARAIAVEHMPATTMMVGGRDHRIAAGDVERVLLFQQLNNRRWALAFP